MNKTTEAKPQAGEPLELNNWNHTSMKIKSIVPALLHVGK